MSTNSDMKPGSLRWALEQALAEHDRREGAYAGYEIASHWANRAREALSSPADAGGAAVSVFDEIRMYRLRMLAVGTEIGKWKANAADEILVLLAGGEWR